MADIILHHFDLSPFAEKIRKVFGIKDISWKSVEIPMVMPKPDLTALTGGYRKTPVMQIGADIYCDTHLIAQKLDALFPDQPLFKSGSLLNTGLQQWSDAAFFPPGAGLSLFENAEHIPEAVSKDREDYFTFLDFKKFSQDAPHFRSQFRAHAALIEEQLSDGRSFLCGDAPEWTDIGAYFNIWMADGNIPSAARMLEGFEYLHSWRAQMDAFGDGTRTEISASDAINIAKAASPATLPKSTPDESGAALQELVTVTPGDHGKVPVEGKLLAINDREIVVVRNDTRAGDVAIHFPRIGYRVTPVS
ncbi:MAG: glutathione S-transferase [Pseudomonadota bacterium]